MTRWHPSQENDELIFAVCDRFLSNLEESGGKKEKGVNAIAEWLQKTYNRPDLSREKIYPLFREAVRRKILLLQPPVEQVMSSRLESHYQLGDHPGKISVVNVSGPSASSQVTSYAADQIIYLIDSVFESKKKKARAEGKDPNQVKVHLGMGAGLATMLVAKRLANRVAVGEEAPNLVLHAISTGGFFIAEPHKAPITYFSYFDDIRSKVEYVALFSETVVRTSEYEKVRTNPGLRRCFERRNEIDIIVTSLANADHEHGLLGQYLAWLIQEGLLGSDVLDKMNEAGWVGDVQFRPYSKEGKLDEVCPVRAVALFELEDLVEMAKLPDKYVILVGGPCGECGKLKTEALRPLLANEKLRLWTHLITDIRTANELLS